MIKQLLLLCLTLLASQSSYAFLDFGKLGRAYANIYSLGEYGREKDREFNRKQLELAQLRRQEAIQRRQSEVAKLNEVIGIASEASVGFTKIRNSNLALYATLEDINKAFEMQLSGAVRIQNQSENSRATLKEQQSDFKLLSALLDHITIPTRQKLVLDLMMNVANDRGLQLEEYIASTFELSQINRENLNELYKKITVILPQLQKIIQENQDEINKFEIKIATDTKSLNALVAAMNKEAADAKSEQEKLIAEEKAAEEKYNSEKHLRMKAEKFERNNSRFAN